MPTDPYTLTHGPSDVAVWRRLYRQTRGTRPPKGWSCARCPEEVVLRDGATPVSFMGMLERDVVVNDAAVHVGGLGYGATHPDYEGRGAMARVIRHALTLFHDRGCPLVFLTCLDALVPYYRDKLGFRIVQGDVWITQPDTGVQRLPREVYLCAWTESPAWRGITSVDLRGKPW